MADQEQGSLEADVIADVNAHAHALAQRFELSSGRDELWGFVCECRDPACRERVRLELRAYQHLRQQGEPVLAKGHRPLSAAAAAEIRAQGREREAASSTGARGHLFARARENSRAYFRGAIDDKNLLAAEVALRAVGVPDLLTALDYVALLAELRPAKAPDAAVRWHGRLETEAPTLTIADSSRALTALIALCQGNREALNPLRQLVQRLQPTLGPMS
jgi:hypothetical protein